MRIRGRLLVLAAASALLVGCGGGGDEETEAARSSEHQNTAKKSQNAEKKPKVAAKKPPPNPEEVSVSVEGLKGPTDIGLILAQERGYFTDVGFSPFVGVPLTPSRSVSYVVEGYDDIGVASQAQVAIARAKGAPIVAIGSLVPQPTAALIWLKKSKIRTIADLKGMTIAIPGVAYQEALLESVLKQHGLTLNDVKLKRVGYKLVPALLHGRADAIFGGSWNLEGIDLKLLGANPVIRRVRDLGIPAYEEAVLFTRTDRVKKEPRMIRKFMAVVARGTTAALKNPAAAIKAVQETPEGNPELRPRTIAAEVKATLPLLSRTGSMDPGQANNLVQWMHGEGLIQEELPASELLTNHFLASP
jgi:putative hydroxymethylpyrimidine transport system substrate-binding protein